MIDRIRYYLSSIPTLLGQVTNWYALPLLLLGKRPLFIKLKNSFQLNIRSLMDMWIVKETCLDRDYEVHGIPILDGWTVIDIGAGIGEFTLLTAIENPSSRVYAYEPFPESFALLEENLKLNGVGNVTAVQTAVSSASGKTQLATTGAAVQHTTTDSTISGTADNVIKVQAIALDDLFQENGLTHCDFLKVDCEGCEFEILLNAAPEVLQRINHICLEYHDGFTDFSHTDLVKYLQGEGFEVTAVSNPVHHYLGFLYAWRAGGK